MGQQVEWQVTRRKAVGKWVEEVLPFLSQFGAPDDVRLVFGFDS